MTGMGAGGEGLPWTLNTKPSASPWVSASDTELDTTHICRGMEFGGGGRGDLNIDLKKILIT